MRAPAAATAQGPRKSVHDSKNGSEDKATPHATQAAIKADPFYVASDIKPAKRFRRTKAAITSVRDAIRTSSPKIIRRPSVRSSTR
jgi:hypothetical protein